MKFRCSCRKRCSGPFRCLHKSSRFKHCRIHSECRRPRTRELPQDPDRSGHSLAPAEEVPQQGQLSCALRLHWTPDRFSGDGWCFDHSTKHLKSLVPPTTRRDTLLVHSTIRVEGSLTKSRFAARKTSISRLAKGAIWQKPRTRPKLQTRTRRLPTRPTRRRGRFPADRRASRPAKEGQLSKACASLLDEPPATDFETEAAEIRDRHPAPRTEHATRMKLFQWPNLPRHAPFDLPGPGRAAAHRARLQDCRARPAAHLNMHDPAAALNDNKFFFFFFQSFSVFQKSDLHAHRAHHTPPHTPHPDTQTGLERHIW